MNRQIFELLQQNAIIWTPTHQQNVTVFIVIRILKHRVFRVKTNTDHYLPAVIGAPKRITVGVSYNNVQVHTK